MRSSLEHSLEDKPEQSRLSRYLLWFAALPVLLYILPFFLMRLPNFETWGGGTFGPMLDFGFRAAGQNADVVIFGDSSALYGIDPNQMSSELGVKVINLPNTLGSLNVTGDLPLERYLRTNTPPHLIVFYIAPYNLNYSHTSDFAHGYEGEEMLLRYGTLSRIFTFGKAHPSELLAVPFRFYRSDPNPAISAALAHEDRAAVIAAGMGHAVADGPGLASTCELPSRLREAASMQSAIALIGRYRGVHAQVLAYLAPVPACKDASVVVQRSYRQIQAAPPKMLPPTSFRSDSFYIHPLKSAVPVATELLIEAIRPVLAEEHSAGAMLRPAAATD